MPKGRPWPGRSHGSFEAERIGFFLETYAYRETTSSWKTERSKENS
jgi:hypothetical protein